MAVDLVTSIIGYTRPDPGLMFEIGSTRSCFWLGLMYSALLEVHGGPNDVDEVDDVLHGKGWLDRFWAL
jgi:hypothetical protein